MSHFFRSYGSIQFLYTAVLCGSLLLCPGFFGELVAQEDREAGVELDPSLVTDRVASQILDRVRSDLENGELIRGLAGLQRVLDSPSDYFFLSPDGDRIVSLRAEANRLVEELDSEAFTAYKLQVEPKAAQLLKESSDLRQLGQVVRRFFQTDSGLKAANQLLTAALDRRDYAAAVQIANEIFDNRRHREQLSARFAIKAVVAASQLGEKEAVRRFSLPFRTENAQVAGHSISLDGFTNSLPDRITNDTPLDDWTIFLGNKKRNSHTNASIPLLRPIWQIPFASQAGPDFRRQLDEWVELSENNLRPLAVSNQAIAIGSQVVFRDFEGVRAFESADGKPLWHYRETMSLAEQLRLATQPNGFRRQRQQSLGIESIYAANSIRGQLACDHHRVYMVEDRSHVDQKPMADPLIGLVTTPNHCLVALPLGKIKTDSSTSIKPVWTICREDVASNADSSISFQFLGPPLPVAGQLLAGVEVDGQVNVLAIDPATGMILWKQALAFQDRQPQASQSLGNFSAAPLAYSGNFLVCPTGSNLWIGLDTFRGQLKWAYSVADQPDSREAVRWRVPTQGEPTFPETPHIADGRVYFLSPQSQFVHCVDLETGQRLWRKPRQQNDLYIGAVKDRVVLLVGRQNCRGLAVDSGEEIWSVRSGMPSGVGFASGNQYLLPLQKGAIAAVDIVSGETKSMVEISEPQSSEMLAHPPGNLIPIGGLVASVNYKGLSVFPQSKQMLLATRKTLQDDPTDAEHRILVAELELLTGDFARAQGAFEPLQTRDDLSTEQLTRRNSIWRKLLTWELANKPERGSEILDQLALLADQPTEQAKFLVQKAEFLLKMRDVAGVLQTATELAASDSETPLLVRADGTHWLSPSTYAQDMMRRLVETVGFENVWSKIDVDERQQVALDSGQPDVLRQFLTLFGDRPQANAVRAALANAEHKTGRFNAAELMWLKNQESENPTEAATATVKLLDMYRELGMFYEANRQLTRLQNQPPNLELMTGESVADVINRLQQQPIMQATRRMSVPTESVESVRIRSSHWVTNLESLTKSFGRYRTRYLLPSELSFHLVDHDISRSGVAAIDRQTGFIAGHVQIPRRNSFPSRSKSTQPGHFLPVGGPGEMLGVSLLELGSNEPLWTGNTQLQIPSVFVPRVGPYGLDYCVFQSQRAIHSIDPRTGRIQWECELDDPESGLKNDPDGGVIGDEHVLVVFGADRRSYRVLQTQTGREIRRGVLDLDVNQVRRSFGRKLFYVAATPTGRRMRIWDPLTDRHLLDERVAGRVFSAVTPERELAIVLPDNTDDEQTNYVLRILDVEHDRIQAEVPLTLEELERVNYLRVFRQGGRYYVNLHQPFQQALGDWFSYYASDTFLPAESVLGELIAIDADANRILWRREIPQRSILELPFFRLPFLVMISRVRDRESNRRQALLVEILDRETGQTLAIADNILPDRIVHATYDPMARELILQGLRTQVTIDFSDHQLFEEGSPL